MRFLTLILTLIITGSLSAQTEKDTTKTEEEKLIQLSGVVVSVDSLDMVSYAAVYNKCTKRGVLSDYYGYFSTVTRPGDTLFFSLFGFKTSSYIVPDTLDQGSYNIIHIMTPDTLEFEPVDVYPWPSKEQFARAFVDMEPYNDAFRKAQSQLSGEALAFAAARLPSDASLIYNYDKGQMQTRIYRQAGMQPVNNLLNPAAWSKFVKSWKAGELQRQ